MKRSSIFLTLAFTVPAAMSLIGLAAGNRGAPGKSDVAASGDLFQTQSGPIHTIRDDVVPVDQTLVVSVSAAESSITFDDSLTNQARVKVETKNGIGATVDVTPTHMSFAPAVDGTAMRITLVLPSHMNRLDFDLNAGKCELTGGEIVAAEAFNITTNAGACTMVSKGLKTKALGVDVASGKLGMVSGDIEAEVVNVNIAAGFFDWAIRDLKVMGGVTPAFYLQSATGSSIIKIDQAPEHSLLADVNMGSLNYRSGAVSESINGTNQQKTIEGPVGSPQFKIEVNMGKADFTVGQLAKP